MLFATFRLGVEFLGVDVVGCWALIQGAMIIARIADSGIPANITRLVSVRRADPTLSIWEYSAAASVLSTLPVALIGGVLIEPVSSYVSHRFGATIGEPTIRMFVLLSYFSGFMLSLAGNFLAIIEGLGRITQRNIITFASALLTISLSWFLIKHFGALGFGLCAALFPFLQLMAGIGFLLRFGPPAVGFDRGRAVEIFRALRSSGFQLTIVGLLRLTFEPVTKLALSWCGSLSTIAAFDLALKIATNTRALLQAGVQPLLAIGARSDGEMSDSLRSLFGRVHRLVLETSAPILAAQWFFTPLLSWMGFGGVNSDFMLFFIVLSFSNSINSVGNIGYYGHLSGGRIRPLVVLYVEMAAMNIAGALVGAWMLGAQGAVLAYVLTLTYSGYVSTSWWLQYGRETWREQAISAFRNRAWLPLLLALVFSLASSQLSVGVGSWPVLLNSLLAGLATSGWTAFKVARFLSCGRKSWILGTGATERGRLL